ncbi:MAG: dihydrodipicolinate reductase [Bacilli bacterium]|nr:dihydrodipicolinate reductase [Bacilli bacterium]
MKDVKVVQYGCGKMSSYTMRYVYEKGGTIVGALDIDPSIIGKDIGEIMGTEKKGILVQAVADAEKVLKETKPDVCIITTMSLMADIEESLLLCAKLGIHAITTCEEAFYPENSSPALTAQIDALAKENHCTITGSGYQDVAWGNLIVILAGTTQQIKKIKGSSSYNVEDYGIALAKAHGAGYTLDQFEKEIASIDNISDEERAELIQKGGFLPSYMWNANGWICDRLDLTVVSQKQKCIPITYEKDLHSETLQMDIKAGDAIGMRAVVVTETKEGITIESECVGKVYAEGVVDENQWEIIGEPNTKVVVREPATVELTCASIINRIPDVLKAESGFIPTSRMGEIKYLKASM